MTMTCVEARNLELRLRPPAKVIFKTRTSAIDLGCGLPADRIEVLQGFLRDGGYIVLGLSLGQRSIADLLGGLLPVRPQTSPQVRVKAGCLIFQLEPDFATPNRFREWWCEYPTLIDLRDDHAIRRLIEAGGAYLGYKSMTMVIQQLQQDIIADTEKSLCDIANPRFLPLADRVGIVVEVRVIYVGFDNLKKFPNKARLASMHFKKARNRG